MRAIAGKSTVVTVLTRTGLVPEIGISAPNVNCACIPVSFRRRQKQAVELARGVGRRTCTPLGRPRSPLPALAPLRHSSLIGGTGGAMRDVTLSPTQQQRGNSTFRPQTQPLRHSKIIGERNSLLGAAPQIARNRGVSAPHAAKSCVINPCHCSFLLNTSKAWPTVLKGGTNSLRGERAQMRQMGLTQETVHPVLVELPRIALSKTVPPDRPQVRGPEAGAASVPRQCGCAPPGLVRSPCRLRKIDPCRGMVPTSSQRRRHRRVAQPRCRRQRAERVCLSSRARHRERRPESRPRSDRAT